MAGASWEIAVEDPEFEEESPDDNVSTVSRAYIAKLGGMIDRLRIKLRELETEREHYCQKNASNKSR